METPDQIEEPNAYDMGISTLVRINYWLWKCNEASYADDAEGYYKAVKTVYKESHTFMKDKEREKHQDWLKKAESSYKEYLETIQNINSLPSNERIIVKLPKKIFDVLFDWELELRSILDAKGLLMKKGEDAGMTMTRM